MLDGETALFAREKGGFTIQLDPTISVSRGFPISVFSVFSVVVPEFVAPSEDRRPTRVFPPSLAPTADEEFGLATTRLKSRTVSLSLPDGGCATTDQGPLEP